MFTDCWVPVYRLKRPAPVELWTVQEPYVGSRPRTVAEGGLLQGQLLWRVQVVLSGMFCWIAADSTKGLKFEPAWKPLASPYCLGIV